MNEIDERKAFEDDCYDYYLKRVAAGEVGTRDAGDGSRGALFWRHHDGTYGVQMFNAAWFGWRERALLAAAPQPAQQAVETLPTRVTEEMHAAACKVLLRAPGLAGTPQRMLDAMLAVAPQPAQKPTALCDCKGRFYDRCESAWEPYCVLGKSAEHAAVSKIAMPKPNVHMDGYVRTDRPNGDGL